GLLRGDGRTRGPLTRPGPEWAPPVGNVSRSPAPRRVPLSAAAGRRRLSRGNEAPRLEDRRAAGCHHGRRRAPVDGVPQLLARRRGRPFGLRGALPRLRVEASCVASAKTYLDRYAPSGGGGGGCLPDLLR